MGDKDNNSKFIENNKVILEGTRWLETYLLITNENNENRFKCKLIEIPDETDIVKGKFDTKEYKLCFGLIHKKTDKFHYAMDVFDILHGQIQDIDYVFYKDKDDKDYNNDDIYKLNGKVLKNTQYNTNGKWNKKSNWFDQKIKAGDTFELIVKEDEKQLIYLINDQQIATLNVRADYPINECYVGFMFHIFQTSKPTIIQ